MGVKKVLVTGTNGLLGQTLVKKLIKREGFQLIASSRGKNRINSIRQEEYLYAEMDISNAEEVSKVFEEHQPDILINTAAMTQVDDCELNQEACYRLNVEAVEILTKQCEKYGTHFIQLSTDFVFDGEEGPYKETDTPSPLSFYGKSKLDAEEILRKSKVKWAIARTIIVYGLVDDMSRSNIVLWAKSALEKKQELNIVNDQFRSPTYVEDLAEGCLLIVEKEAMGIFHLSGKDIMSISELVRRVAKFYNLDDSYINEISSDILNQAAKRPPRTGFILDKSRKELGYDPHSFEEGMLLLQEQFDEKQI